MTTADNPTTYRYEGNGITATFAYDGRVFEPSDLIVEIITRATDVKQSTLTLTTDYSVTIDSDGTGSVTVTAANIPSALQDILIRRKVPKDQTTSLPTGTVFPAKAVETALDRVVAITQDISADIDRSAKVPASFSGDEITLPLPEDGKILSWDGDAGVMRNVSVADLDASLDTVISGLTSGDILEYNGTNWVNTPPSTETIVTNNGYASGRYYFGLCSQPISNTALLTADRLYARPFYVAQTETFTKIGIEVTSAVAASVIRLGIYNMANGLPTALILDAGTVDGSSTGLKEITISQELESGLYAVAWVSNGAPTVRQSSALNVFGAHIFGASAADVAAGSMPIGVYYAYPYGALPVNYSASVTYNSNSTALGGIWLRL
jgi:hypothetical protein